jgi:hypothetical protein
MWCDSASQPRHRQASTLHQRVRRQLRSGQLFNLARGCRAVQRVAGAGQEAV